MNLRQVIFILFPSLLVLSTAFAGLPVRGNYDEELKTVPFVDVSRYLGRWYQISRNSLPFEGECACAQQTLTANPDGTVGVYNSCNDKTPSGVLREIRGYAVNDDLTSNSKFTVDFFLPQKGKYWIIGLDSDYRYAVVSDPSRSSLYILSKTPFLEPELFNKAVEEASSQINTSNLRTTEQQGCTYPSLPTKN